MTAPGSPCPNVNGFGARVMLFGGLALMFAGLAVGAFVKGVSIWIPIVGMAFGGALIPNAKLAEIINNWVKRRNGAA